MLVSALLIEMMKIMMRINDIARMKYLTLMSALSLGVGLSQLSIACSCPVSLSTEAQVVDAMLQDASLIFVGKVTASLPPTLRQNKRGFRFEVQESFKGVTSQSLVVLSALSSAECGTTVLPGKTYLVAAYGAVTAPVIHVCERPLEVEFADTRLALLRERRTRRNL